MFSIVVKDEEFQEWLKRTENAFVYMIQTMKDVAQVVKENTLPLTPFEYGFLGGSFKPIVLTDTAREKLIMIRMSALNRDTGYDYAWIQHENMNYHHGHTKVYEYSHRNTSEYLTNDVVPFSLWDTNHPQAHYLMEGIIQSQDMAYELIEEDYLSLFNRGYIF